MSSSYREESNKAKAARQGIVEQVEKVAAKKKLATQVVVEYRYAFDTLDKALAPWRTQDWRNWGSYRSEAVALAAVANLSRKYKFYELRIQPKGEIA